MRQCLVSLIIIIIIRFNDHWSELERRERERENKYNNNTHVVLSPCFFFGCDFTIQNGYWKGPSSDPFVVCIPSVQNLIIKFQINDFIAVSAMIISSDLMFFQNSLTVRHHEFNEDIWTLWPYHKHKRKRIILFVLDQVEWFSSECIHFIWTSRFNDNRSVELNFFLFCVWN